MRTAAGFVVFAMRDGEPVYLMMRSARHGTWAPPKGHSEPGESALETARRETEEETGITDAAVIEGFRREVEYQVEGQRKVVTWFLAQVPEPVHTQSPEHNDSGWFTLDEAVKRAQFEQMRQVLREADAFFRNLRQ